MDDKKELLNRLIISISIILFVVLSVINLINHTVWLDEAIAWSLAKNITLNNVVITLKNEGHFIIWYLLIMPFAKNNVCYPVPMSVINWLAYFFAILVMWRKAPFNNFFKILITFSWLSLNYYSVVARCYSIGILGLFILLATYKDQIKHPYFYTIMLVLTAHTSLLATLPVVPLACIFMYNLLKNQKEMSRKNIILPLIILFIGVFLWFLPFLHGYGYDGKAVFPPEYHKILEFFNYKHYIMLYLYILSIIWILIFADNKIRFFTAFTLFEFLVFFCFVMGLAPHHGILLITYLILFFWMTPKLHSINRKTVPFMLCFIILLYWNHFYHMSYIVDNADKSNIINFIKKQDKNNTYFFLDTSVQDIIPYIYEYNYTPLHPRYNDESNIDNNIKYFINVYQIDSKVFLISEYKINDKSIEFKIYRKNSGKGIKIYATPYEGVFKPKK